MAEVARVKLLRPAEAGEGRRRLRQVECEVDLALEEIDGSPDRTEPARGGALGGEGADGAEVPALDGVVADSRDER